MSCYVHTKTQISVGTVTVIWGLSFSTAPVVSSTELSEKEEDGKLELLSKHWSSLSPSLSMSVVSKLNLHT